MLEAMFQKKIISGTEVSGEVTYVTFCDTSIERPLLLFKMTMRKSSGFPLR